MSLSDEDFTESVTQIARSLAAAAEAVNVAALAEHVGQAPLPPPLPRVAELRPDPTFLLRSPWQERVVSLEPIVDLIAARATLGAAIGDRTEAAAAHAAATAALNRADALIADVEGALADQAARAEERTQNLGDRLRDWITAGSPGERPAAGAPELSTRTAAELAGAHVARLGLADDYAAARAAHARAVEAVDAGRRQVLRAEGQAIASQLDAAEATLGDLRTQMLALLNVRVAGDLVWQGTLRERLTSLPPLAREDAGVAPRWADYAARLADDADADL